VKGYCAHGLASTWPSCLGRLILGWQPTVKNRGGWGALAVGAQRRRPRRCQRPGSEDRWRRRLEGYIEMVNQFEGFAEEGAHHMELSMGARLTQGGTMAMMLYGVGPVDFGSRKQQCNGVVLEEVAAGQEDDQRRCSTVVGQGGHQRGGRGRGGGRRHLWSSLATTRRAVAQGWGGAG
jgi:hypothetical protein